MDAVHVYTHVHNEGRMLPFFLRHYSTFADRIIVYIDPDTDDNSRAIVAACDKAEARTAPVAGLVDMQFVEFASQTIRESAGKAAWAMWPDCDEFICAPDMLRTLRSISLYGHDVVMPARGWQMVSGNFPQDDGRQIYDVIPNGVPEIGVCKPIVVNPAREVHWQAGKHRLAPGSKPQFVERTLSMLHFRKLGLEYHLERNAKNWQRIGADDRALGHGYHTAPQYAEGERAVIAELLERAQRVTL